MYNRLYNFTLRRARRARWHWSHHSVSRHPVSRHLAVFNIFLKSVILPPTPYPPSTPCPQRVRRHSHHHLFSILAKMCNTLSCFAFQLRCARGTVSDTFFLFLAKCVTPPPILPTITFYILGKMCNSACHFVSPVSHPEC